jgi:hypothetical protein
LLCCFKKESHLRKTADKLLEHQWIKNAKIVQLKDVLSDENINYDIELDTVEIGKNIIEEKIEKKGKLKNEYEKNSVNKIKKESEINSLNKIKNLKFDKILNKNLEELWGEKDENYLFEEEFDLTNWKKKEKEKNKDEEDERNLEEEFNEIEKENNDPKEDFWNKKDQEIKLLIENLQPNKDEDVVLESCKKLIDLFKQYPSLKESFSKHHGVLPIIDMLEVSNIKVLHSILKVLNEVFFIIINFIDNY